MTDWVRLWHDMPTDPKWRVVARKSGQSLPCVLAIFTLMLTNASNNAAERGTLLAWDHEDAGAALDMDGEDVAAIYDAMQGKVLEGDRLTGWERRQPKREDNSKERVAKHRSDKKRAVTLGNAPETDTETDKKDGEAKASLPVLRPEHVVEAWNAMADRRGLAKVVKLTDERRKTLNTRIKEHPIEDFTEAIGAIERSPFLLGESKGGWRADFDFLLQKSSFVKLIEGSYERNAH